MSEVLYELRDRAAWLTLNRPQRRNAVSPAMIAALDAALDRALDDEQARAVVLTGSGPAFCAGADLHTGRDLATAGDGGRNPFAALLQRLQQVHKPVIAAVNGPAFGGGLGLVAAADIALAADGATFSFSEVRLGLIPAMISVVVLPKIGPHHARRLFVTGRRFSAEEALGYGLVHGVVPPDGLVDAVNREVADIAKGGPVAVAEAKALIRELMPMPENQAFDRASAWFAELVSTDEAREGMAAFAQKRAPEWR